MLEASLAEAYAGEGNYSAATPLIEKALAKERATLPESHFELARSHMIAAAVQEHTRHHSEADAHYRQALDIFRSSLASGHPDLVKAERAYARFAKGMRE